MKKTAEILLKDLGAYKSMMLEALLQSTELCELLLGEGCTQEQAGQLVNTRIFPYAYKPEPHTAPSYLCLETEISKIPTAVIKEVKVILWCYCHKDHMAYTRPGYEGTRADILADMADRALRSSKQPGIGKLSLDSAAPLTPADEYYGRQIIYTFPDFRCKKA